MSPEPSQETTKDLDINDLNENARIPAPVSDSEDEDPYNAGYTLLSDNPNDAEMEINDDDEDEDEWTIPTTHQNIPNGGGNGQMDVPTEVLEIWSSNSNRSEIDLDSDKICQVKSLMASFTLPSSVIPEWASKISEEEWKEQLIERISEIQKKNTN